MWLGSPLLLACSWSASDQQPCSICLSPALPAWVASCVRLQARSGGEAISVCCVFCAFHRRRHRYSRLHRPAALHQRSNVRLAPSSLTSTPPGGGAGMEAEEAARQYTAIAMILKSHAHTAARKLRRHGCCGSASSAALHGAHIIVPILTTTQSSHSWGSGPFGGSLHGLPC